ncbi:PREDICTED: NADH dehydrogenase [ubiquinone] 1 beta subcomplex subunit 11, mitochondrial [Nicrophorus vespilloides]|uniref:NADH dehydrogenase [ubiquinone] 1 beta subcomplex subunit 11, mitochondrial n=1 Tax=Nicrophorus vespilloides TaxID=110193 RepID=A0ABM1NEK8_NICVS|nr:PREDICTED: NADH dehydrogenase [ubiquinone] 1 beta subcomplex subunit 11, mitochondrial [Nicrophorus vespilloides]
MSGVMRFQMVALRRAISNGNRRFISTSKKNSDTVNVAEAACKSQDASQATIPKRKNWVSYGFDHKSKEADRNALHSIMFISVTGCLVLGGYYFMYLPDYNLRDWSQREAFLELQRREAAGLPAICKDLIDPSNIVLPTDEELGDTEIII